MSLQGLESVDVTHVELPVVFFIRGTFYLSAPSRASARGLGPMPWPGNALDFSAAARLPMLLDVFNFWPNCVRTM